MVHLDMFSKVIMSMDVKPNELKLDIKSDEVNDHVKQRMIMLNGVLDRLLSRETENLGFGVVIRSSDNGSDRRQTFVTMIYKRSGTYQPNITNSKRDDVGSRKCECSFKLRGYGMADKTWKFNVIFGIHNHDLNDNLVGHPIVCRLVPEERGLIPDMILNMVASKNILAF
ncbi:uncharacterized protein LOC127105845 [Lathyrus oleraceus]|uniref:uncharacterized protein LOC127105845 n=1 Tax=Pisum sativum TaxID=3888 RepID=UPI0021D3D9A4|nr:uncharacterized protein LOC127105845 [Pisum sativum]